MVGVGLRFCYEAGPYGNGIQRHLSAHGHECVVVAPSLIPKPNEAPKSMVSCPSLLTSENWSVIPDEDGGGEFWNGLTGGGSSQERTRLRNGISRPILALKKLVTVVKSSNKNSFATEHPA